MALALAVGAAAFFLRIATFEFSNDDYLHMVSAQQVLLGDMPVRDFIDPGEPLFYSVSAAVQRLLGPNMLSEVLLDVTALSVAYVFMFLLSARLARSRLVALIVVGLAILLVPRLYAYPKLLLYAVNLWLIWRYADAPGLARLAAVALSTAVAFLFRHDHGACIGIAMGAMLVLVHAQEGWRPVLQRVVAYGAITTLLLSPFLLVLQLNGGIVGYFQNTLDIARGEYQRTVGEYPRFRLALAAPRVRVQWTTDVGGTARDSLAAQYALSAPSERGGGEWEYDLNDRSVQNLSALVADPHVAATEGFDRRRFNLLAPVTEPNVLAWFYYLTAAAAPLALLVIGVDIWRRVPRAWRPDDRRLVTAAVLAIVMNLFLLRAASESAVGDVSAITCVVAAWLLARGWRATHATWGAALRILLTLAVLGVSTFLAFRGNGGFAVARTFDLLQQEGLAAVPHKLDSGRRLTAPFDNVLAQYLFACTAPTDRVLLTWYAPEIQYGSGRGFAAGRPYFITSFATSARAQAFSLARLRRERVPVVLVSSDYEPEFARPFPTIAAYLREYYREVGALGPSDDPLVVLADQRLTPVSTYLDTGLPCFR